MKIYAPKNGQPRQSPKNGRRSAPPQDQQGQEDRRPLPPFYWQFMRRCPHCNTACVHNVKHCGQYRICSVCTLCNWHKRIGARMSGVHS